MDVDHIPDGRISWNVAWEFIAEILREPSSHLVSAINGDRYVPDPAERAAWAVFEQWVNTQMPKGSRRRVERPWAGKKPTYQTPRPENVTPEREARRAQLAAMF